MCWRPPLSWQPPRFGALHQSGKERNEVREAVHHRWFTVDRYNGTCSTIAPYGNCSCDLDFRTALAMATPGTQHQQLKPRDRTNHTLTCVRCILCTINLPNVHKRYITTHLVPRVDQAAHVDGQSVHREGRRQEGVVGVAVDVAHLRDVQFKFVRITNRTCAMQSGRSSSRCGTPARRVI